MMRERPLARRLRRVLVVIAVVSIIGLIFWDMRQGRTNKALEDVIIKSVAAFANWQGGTLLIGVSDEGEILGLEADYASLNGDHDRFELHLRNLLNQNFGTAFVANRVKIRFHTINEQDICQIDVQPAVVVVIEQRNAAAHRLDQVTLVGRGDAIEF